MRAIGLESEAELLLREDVGEDSEGPEIPLMRRMSLPMAMEHAKKMVNGEPKARSKTRLK